MPEVTKEEAIVLLRDSLKTLTDLVKKIRDDVYEHLALHREGLMHHNRALDTVMERLDALESPKESYQEESEYDVH